MYCSTVPVQYLLLINTEYAKYSKNKSQKLLSRPASHTVQGSGVQCMHLLNTEKRNDFLDMKARDIFSHSCQDTNISCPSLTVSTKNFKLE
jgi:hypothetical protein